MAKAGMSQLLTPDICVIGAGTGGLVVAAGASQLGAKTVLIEDHRMGGDCLNTGCVPSKALLAAAHAAVAHRRAEAFGLEQAPARIDFSKVQAHVRGVIAAIAPNDSQERFTGLGVTVLREHARFTGPDEVVAGESRIRARRFVVATGSMAFVPPLPGLADLFYYTNESIFDVDRLPEHLLIMGGGPIGCELAQAFARLGAKVSIVEMLDLMPKDDPELVEVVRRALKKDGVGLFERHKVVGAAKAGAGIALEIEKDGPRQRIEGSHLLVAAGRRARVKDLGLESAGIEYSDKGIRVDRRLRTTNARVFAVGDVAGGPQFTHLAAYHAGIVIRNALFRLPAKVDLSALPWVTFTEPELAHVGLSEAAARAEAGTIRLLRWPVAENDRAQSEHLDQGFIKIVTNGKGSILGADIVGPSAGEMIHLWTLAVSQRLKIGAVARMIAPYPTLSEIGRRAAGNYYMPTLFGQRTKRLVRLLARFG
jgi:pyruvate/2-oxoglutarate dehydrogenase complex dihydrolipoamide dehydrogenase (E3) component